MKRHSQSELRPKSQHHRRSGGVREERHHRASKSIPGQSTDPDMLPGETEPEDGTSNLGELPKLKEEVASFL